MNILIIHSTDDAASPGKPLRTPEEMQFGISYVSSLLKRRSHNTKLLVLSRMLGKRNNKAIDRALQEFLPKVVFFTAVTSEYHFVAAAARYIRARDPGLYLICGGPHVSLNPDIAIRDVFDAICVGEGEYASLELVSQLEAGVAPHDIPNLWIKKGGAIEKNRPREFLQDLDGLPFPDREMWAEWIGPRGNRRQPVLLSRGCPFSCSYCCNHALRKIQGGPYVRFRAPENIVREIETIIAKKPSEKDFYLEVETIGADMKWAMELCAKLELLNAAHGSRLTFGTNLRITRGAALDDLFRAFKRSGFRFVRIGVESGCERVRREILRRDYSNQDVIDTVALARRHGLGISFYNLIGVPGETAADFKETIALNRICQPDNAYAHIYFPYPGTELYKVCMNKGLLKGLPKVGLERCRAVLDLPYFPKKAVERGFVWFDFDVYKGQRPLFKLLIKTIISKCRSHAALYYLYRSCSHLPILNRFKGILSGSI